MKSSAMRSFLREQFARIQGSLKRRTFEREFDDEVRDHLALLTERFMRQGLSKEDAEHAAKKQFGGIAQVKDTVRNRSRLPFLEAVLQDVAYVLRQFRRSPLFATAAILTLALGIGANTAIFSLVDQLILRLLPVKDPQRIVMLLGEGKYYGSSKGYNVLSYTMYQTLREKNQVFSNLMCRRPMYLTILAHAQSEVVSGELASGNYFPLLGVKAAVGHLFNASDDLHINAHPLAVLSYGYWQSRFAGDSAIIGSTIDVNNHQLTIVGVSQPGFYGLEPGLPTQIFVPLAMTPALFPHDDISDMFDASLRWVTVYGRLKPGISLTRAQAGLQPLFHQILRADLLRPSFANAMPYDKERFLRMWLHVLPGGQGNMFLRRQYERPLLVLMGVVGFVLLIACANLASLLAARAAARQKEIAVRLAIGSSRARLVQQLLTESLVLAVIGGLAGIAIALAIFRSLLTFLPENIGGYALSSSLDGRMLVFAGSLSVLTGIVFGLIPALQASSPNLAGTLKAQTTSVTGGSSQVTFRKALVVTQIVLSLLLLIGASLFIRSLAHLHSLDPGFRTQSAIQFDTELDSIGYDPARAHDFFSRLEARLSQLPGVRTAGVATNPVLSNNGGWVSTIKVAGDNVQPGEDNLAYINAVSPGFFKNLGIYLLSGRAFRESDTAATRKVVVVNRSFAKHYFGNEDAVGHRIGRGIDPGTPTDMEIVGVVNDTDYENLQSKAPRQVFLCGAQSYELSATVYLGVQGDPKSMFATIRRVVHEMEPKAPIMQMKTVEHQLDESLVTERMVAALSTGFSILASALSILGLYGVIAYMVTQRAREIGIRIALGALFGNVIWLVMRQVVVIVSIGIVLALPLVFALARLIQSELYGIQPTDAASIASAVAVLSAVALIAGYIPARRAASADPLRVLRYE